jgi:hypothetical protein
MRWKARPKGKTRKRSGEMNKLEAAYAGHLQSQQISGDIEYFAYESVKFRLADRTWFTPDFLVMARDGAISFHETKGFMRDDAAVKLKTAAEMYPFPFLLVRKIPNREGGGWQITEV